MKALRHGALAALFLAGCSHAPDRAQVPVAHLPPSCARRVVQLEIVGDSLARGWGASKPENSFASLVYDDVKREHANTTMRNFGIPGATTDEIAAKEISRIPSAECQIVVVIAGANDVQKLYTPHHFQASYDALLAGIRTRSPRAALVVLGLPDVALTPLIPWILKPLESHLAKQGNASIGEVAHAYGAAFVPLYDLSHAQALHSTSLISRDGIHPNDAGYRMMAAAAAPSIIGLLH